MAADRLPTSSAKGKSNGVRESRKSTTKTGLRAKMDIIYREGELRDSLKECIKKKQSFKNDGGVEVHVNPFTCCVMPKLLNDEDFIDGLKDELLDLDLFQKNNDLYKFQQSDDLKNVNTPHISAFRKLMYEDVQQWMSDVTGIELNSRVDLTCSRYDYTDILLCHDDELEGRRIAFILYLVPPWSPVDGGSLDLFNMDEHGQPSTVAKSLYPACDTFAWFEVTPASHHQVAEVLAEDKTRLSINGWFHGPPIHRPEPYVEPPLPLKPYVEIDEDMLYEWINPTYLDPIIQSEIQEKFEMDSEIELQKFLREDKYAQVVAALQDNSAVWRHRGPPNKRSYRIINDGDMPDIIQQCLTFLQSEPMFLILSNLTGLSLHPLAGNDSSDSESDTGSYTGLAPPATGDKSQGDSDEDSKPKKKRRKLERPSGSAEASEEPQITNKSDSKGNPRCRSEVRQWQQGNYTLVHDTDTEGAEFALDAMLFCACRGWDADQGGYTSYIARGEDEELLTVNPEENSLALVYRDKDTLRFVKHINSHIKEKEDGPQFYDLSLTYFE